MIKKDWFDAWAVSLESVKGPRELSRKDVRKRKWRRGQKEKDRERKGRGERVRETEDLCNKAETQADGKQNAWKQRRDNCSRGERDAHYRAIDRPTENGRNGREGETRDNREENSFLLAPKGTAGGRQAKTISGSMKREETKNVNNDDINVLQRKRARERERGARRFFCRTGKRCVKWISRRVTERVKGERARYKASHDENSKLSRHKDIKLCRIKASP